jgi:nucleotide-binding universal stress UspA family protein
MFDKILFATSGTPACDHAARVAFETAQKYGSKLVIFHVLGVPTRGYSQIVVDIRTGEEVTVDADYLDWVKEELKNTYARLLDRYENVEIEVIMGLPHREILRLAREIDADLVVMGATSGEAHPGSLNRMGFAGSTLQRVAKSARCPVLSVARQAASFWGGFSSVVFCTDFTKASDNAFEFSLNLAKKLNCELHVFHSLDISSMHAGKFLSQEQIEEQLLEIRGKMRAKYESKLKELKDYSIEVWEGVPYVEIVKFARENQSDLLVMAHNQPVKGPDDIHMGSTMEQVIMRANCPVLSVNKPDKVQL